MGTIGEDPYSLSYPYISYPKVKASSLLKKKVLDRILDRLIFRYPLLLAILLK
jgi:hypothetical protein